MNSHINFSDKSCAVRTNESFRKRLNPEHHHSESILEQLPIDMIICLPNDYMHSICKGTAVKQTS
jgi:hypothetical protein